MNKHRLLSLTTVVLFCFISCSKQTTYNFPDISDVCVTKSINESDNNSSDEYFVSRKDIDAYLNYKKLLVNNTSFGVKSVEPLIYNSEETLGYIINYNDGWEIISGDKRTPIIIAYDETGQLTTENLKQGGVYSVLKTWLDGLMKDIQSIHETPNYYNDNQDYSKGVVQSLDFWKAISNPDSFIKEHTTETKALSDPFPSNGHWVLISVTTTSQSSTVNLTTTQWGQYYPYNYYCPPPSQGAQTNSLVGCVAVAGAQQLYYLHNYLGQPSSAPTSISFTGYGPNNYTMSVGPFSNLVWSNMNSGYSDETGILLAYVGGQVFMDYGSSFSGAYTEDLVDNVFNPNGLDCNIYYSLTTSILYDNLLSGIPLVVAGKNPYDDLDRHTFIIDKYKKTDFTTIYIYEWVEDPIIEGNNQPRANQKQVIEYSTNINEIGMNWGWNGDYNNTWFTLSSNWIVGELNYSVVRLVIADFCVLDNA